MLANITPEVQEYLLNELKKDTEDKKSFEQHKIRSIRKDIEKNEQQMDGLVNTLALPSVSSITRDRCDKKIQSLNDESTLLKQKLANFSSSINNFEM
jgi:NAD(P)H-dependent flavin oxidoreductase YrpB (nitropropane dioxygenase family)